MTSLLHEKSILSQVTLDTSKLNANLQLDSTLPSLHAVGATRQFSKNNLTRRDK